MRKSRVLIVDDEPGILEVCADTLGYLENVEIVTEIDSTRAAKLLSEGSFDLLLTDLRMPGLNGVELLREGRKHDPDLPALIVTAYPSVESAVETMKMGGVDYITKPFLPDELLITAKRLLKGRELQDENRLLRRQVKRHYHFEDMIGESDAMQKVFALIHQISQSDVDVLILGETGTGKELVARSIHQISPRSKERFVPVDCGAIPENLLESEFFGHEKGAFTGAHARSIGLMEFAYGGTFFLDELGELPLHMQAKLLRVLQERKVRRIGGKEEFSINLRVVAATRQDIDVAVSEGRFREDLFFRINVVRIELPPLRKRLGDIEPLARHFLKQHTKEANKDITGIDHHALQVLERHNWPGNIRELQNAIRHAIAMSGTSDTIYLEHLPAYIIKKQKLTGHNQLSGNGQDPTFSTTLTESDSEREGFQEAKEQLLATFELQYLNRLLSFHQGDVTAAARASKLPRATFYRLMKKRDVFAKEFRKKN